VCTILPRLKFNQQKGTDLNIPLKTLGIWRISCRPLWC